MCTEAIDEALKTPDILYGWQKPLSTITNGKAMLPKKPPPSRNPPPLTRRPSGPPPLKLGRESGGTRHVFADTIPSAVTRPEEGQMAPQWWSLWAGAAVALGVSTCVILVFAVHSSGPGGGVSLAELTRATEPSVMHIYVFTESGVNTGTGFLIGNEGAVVTNWHVIEGAQKAYAELHDGRAIEISGCLVGDSSAVDLAILQMDCPAHLLPPPLQIAGTLPEKGEKVFALGNPLELAGSVSDGIVSAVRNRTEHAPEYIQHTAATSPGNSGGPLLNSRAEVVGVNTWIVDPSVGQNLNFAVSSRELLLLMSRRPTSRRNFPLKARAHE